MRTSTKFRTRANMTPPGYTETFKDEGLGVSLMQSADRLSLMFFSGRRQKADYYLKFKTAERALNWAKQNYDVLKASAADKSAYKAAQCAKAGAVVVGAVFVSSWGYDQTNINFYQVTALIGKQTVEVRELKKEKIYAGDGMTGTAVPLVGEFVSDPYRRRINGERIKINSCESARLADFSECCGVKVYKPMGWTAYA